MVDRTSTDRIGQLRYLGTARSCSNAAGLEASVRLASPSPRPASSGDASGRRWHLAFASQIQHQKPGRTSPSRPRPTGGVMLEAPHGSRAGVVRDGAGSLLLPCRSVNPHRAGSPRVSVEVAVGVRSGMSAHRADWATRPGIDRDPIRQQTLCCRPSCATDYSRGVQPASAAALSAFADWPGSEAMAVQGELKRLLGVV